MKELIQIKNKELNQSSNFDSNSDSSLSFLKRKIMLSNSQLIKCSNDHVQFFHILQELNQYGIMKINEEQYEQSLLYLGEGQRILQYAASCGKSIDRALILSILHNEACAYQRLYDLPKLASYLEALLYNLNFTLKKSQNICNIQSNILKNSQSVGEHLKRKRQYAIYHLQYCALNSKNYEHQNAIKAVQQSLIILKQICGICWSYEKIKLKKNKSVQEKIQCMSNQMLNELSSLKIKLQTSTYQKYLKKVKKLLDITYKEKQAYENVFKDFSIGKIMQITPITIQEVKSANNLDKECSDIDKVMKALLMAAGFFSIGTQLRLLSAKQQNYKSSDKFLLSQVYHIYCIYLVLTYVPCQTSFLNHLLTSYNNHYCLELELKYKKKNSIQQLEKQVFQSDQSGSQASERQQKQERQVIETLPEHSSIQMRGQSKWSKSKIKKSPESAHKASQKLKNLKKKSYHKKDSSISITKIKQVNEYGSSRKNNDELTSSFEQKLEAEKYFQFGKHRKGLYKIKTQQSVKKTSSLHSHRKKKKKLQKKETIKCESKAIKQILEERNKKTKSKSKLKDGEKEKMASCEKDKDFLKGLKEMKSQLKIKRQNAQKECQKKSKSRQKKIIRIGSQQNLLGSHKILLIHQKRNNKGCEKTLQKSKHKKSLESKKRLKKTLK